MKSKLKNVYFDAFIEALNLETKINLTIPEKSAIANLLSSEAIYIHDANFDILKEEHKVVVLDQEKTRAQFIGFVNFIEKYTKIIIENLRKNSLIYIEHDATKKRNIMKCRTTVVKDCVDFVNKMNELVMKYYEDVYKIDLVDDRDKNKDNIQGKLF